MRPVAPISDPPIGTVISPAVMLSPNARYRTFDSCASFDTLTLKVHVPVRFSASVAVQVTSVAPIGNVAPDCGEHDTVTEPWPPLIGGVSKLTLVPLVLTV